MNSTEELKQMTDQFANNLSNIPPQLLVRWMTHSDSDIQTCLFNHIWNVELTVGLKELTVSEEDLDSFLSKFLLKTMVGRIDDKKKSLTASDFRSPFDCAYSLQNLFVRRWNTSSRNIESLSRIKNHIAEELRTADFAMRECLMLGILEHLFQIENVLRYFEDWQEDATLKPVFAEARDLAKKW